MNKLYRLYMALAAFVVMTTAFSLIVQRSVMSTYDASTAASSRYVSHKAAYDSLRLLASRVEAAANEVFGNGDVEKQSAQRTLAFGEFNRPISAERHDII